ncbi:hypothetical protein BKA62DRAFT_796142 [Auriculariales sp. MPI-PUGE-AT-0066]|nr:hypothetical protein BKA62DRAFT_796142 [Auriculariales sp. MPI-PUGE-AT-0066]
MGSTVVAAVTSSFSQRSAEYLRIASISLAAYDFLLTLPYEYRFYATQWKRPSLACTLFFLIRYSSVLILVISNVGQFASFSDTACDRYYILAPVFKVLQIFVSQLILAIRTFAISWRSRTVAVVLIIAVVVCTIGEGVGSIYARVPNRGTGHCTSGNAPGLKVAWLHYIFGMAFDVLTLAISSYYLLGRQPCAYISFRGVARIMLVDGLGYFAVLTAANVINVIFWTCAPQPLQSAAASLGYAFTMIACQRILISLRDIAEHSRDTTPPKRPTTYGVSGPEASAAHEMSICVTIQRDVEGYADDDAIGTKRNTSVDSNHKAPFHIHTKLES